jgi:hypothetical protein
MRTRWSGGAALARRARQVGDSRQSRRGPRGCWVVGLGRGCASSRSYQLTRDVLLRYAKGTLVRLAGTPELDSRHKLPPAHNCSSSASSLALDTWTGVPLCSRPA